MRVAMMKTLSLDRMETSIPKNMLECFQGQGGMAGPADNLMGLMGMGSKLPRK